MTRQRVAPKSLKELRARLKAAGPLTKEQRARMVCLLVGHSRIQESWFGYYSCSRCEEQLGDSLAGIYMAADAVVVVGHNCNKCRDNFKLCDWRDTFMAKKPFTDEPPQKKGRKQP